MERISVKALLATVVLALSVGLPAYAQQLSVGTGGPKGTYATQFQEMQKACGNELPLVPVASSGAVENLERLINNEINMGYVQSDLLFRRARIQDLSNIKTLLAMHTEQIHFVARNEVRKSGGVMGIGGDKWQLRSIDQLAGLKVAAAGGSVETAKQIKTDSDIGYTIVEAASADFALNLLREGKVDAALLVGGAPLGNLRSLGQEYTLLSVPQGVYEKIKGAYKPARVTYSQMGAQGVQTVAIDALLVTREYKTPRMVEALGRFRQCVLSKIEEIKETTGTHSSWQTVDPDNKGRWAWYELPGGAKAKK